MKKGYVLKTVKSSDTQFKIKIIIIIIIIKSVLHFPFFTFSSIFLRPVSPSILYHFYFIPSQRKYFPMMINNIVEEYAAYIH